jgi:hypothetical protein
LLLSILSYPLASAHAQGTAFTYQGRLNDGTNPASGVYDFSFALFNASTGGSQVGGTVTNLAVGVTNGLFTTTLDFGGVFTGNPAWLAISVRTNGMGGFTSLNPLQNLTPTPYASYSANAGNANNLAGLSVQPNANSGAPNLIGGSPDNFVSSGVIGATIGGGGATNIHYGPASHQYTNSVTGSFGTVGGGAVNTAGYEATVGGGFQNTASGDDSTVGGGYSNSATAGYAAVPGGMNNLASGQFSFAAGDNARATNDGAFVWADAQGPPFGSTTTNQFNVRANGGVRFVTGGAGLTVDGPLSGNGTTVWQVPAGITVQAQANTGYLLTNSQNVTVTLPGSPNVGDVVEVFGSGLGGWTLAQNAAQSVLYNYAYPAGAWVQTSAPGEPYWSCIASSADGRKLAATVGSGGGQAGGIFTSTNSGINWNPTTAPTEMWLCIASSSDGSKLAAVELDTGNSGGIYTSTNSGANWTLRTNVAAISIASSSDGSKLAAVVGYGGGNAIGTSTNFGFNWSLTNAPSPLWCSIASSSDGSKLAAVEHGGGIYTSVNSGRNWAQTSAPSTNNWTSIASSSDGSKLAALMFEGGIYTSSDSGAHWSLTSAPTNAGWNSIASSSDGSKLAAADGNWIYSSTDFGAHWSVTSAPNEAWSCVACSSDGSKWAAVVAWGGGIWTSGYNNKPGATTTGTAGLLGGGQGSGVKLIYAGGGQFVVVNQQGSLYGL